MGQLEDDTHLTEVGSGTASSGPSVVMIADSNLPKLTSTSVWLAEVTSSSLITQLRVGSTKSLNMGPPVSAMRASDNRAQV